MSLTKEMSATTRMILESIQILVVWCVSLALEWQKFYFLQPLGFLVMIVGFCLYYDLLFIPFMRKYLVKKTKIVNMDVENATNMNVDCD